MKGSAGDQGLYKGFYRFYRVSGVGCMKGS